MIYNHRILPMVVGGVIIGCPNLQTIIHDDLWMISSHIFDTQTFGGNSLINGHLRYLNWRY